jgi:Luciferase-like monooxygenase
MSDQPTNSTASTGEEAAFPLVLGLDTFGDRTNTDNGQQLSHAQTIRNVVEEGVLAEQVGVDFFGIGEHHTDYFPMPAGDVVLASIAARTQRIHLGSAVTVQLRRPGPGVPALLDLECSLERSG